MNGQTISYYRILDQLGVGGMGEVYLAEDTRLGRKLALKLLPAQYTQDANRVRRFEQEARAASGLNHPNILTIYEIGQHEGAHFIATEYVEGETLRQLLQRQGLNLADALDLAIQAASALQAAHQANIVHRDIKPENIMRRPDGYVKLLDFGLAKLTQSEGETKPMGDNPHDNVDTQSLLQTMPGLVMGTIAYMSPEQARGQRVDGRTDLFSLGVVLYEMVVGRRPFSGATQSDMIASLLREEPTRLSLLWPAVPAELEQVIHRLLAKDRDARYATAQELIADLKRIKARLDATVDESTTRALKEPSTAQMSYETNVAQVAYATNDTSAAPFSAASSTPAQGARPAAPLANKPVISRKALVIAIGAVVLFVGTLFGLFFYNARQRTIDAIAVLPFYTADAKAAPLTDGLTEEVINAVANLPEVSVIARNSVIKYKARETDPVTVGEELNVQAVLTGEVSQYGNDTLVQVELTDAKTRRRIWGKSFTRKLDALYALQSDIVQGLSQKLNLRMNFDDNARLAQQDTKNGAAYRLYLEGRHYYNQGTPEAMHKADALFEQAFGLDSTFINAAAGCAACHAYGADQQPPNEVMPKARTVAQVALKGDPNSADAHLTLARVALRYDWDFKEAERLLNRAIELEPKNPATYQRYAEFLALMERHKEATAAIYQARKLDPRSLPINSDIGTLSYFAADYEHAFEHFQQTLKLDKDFVSAHTGLGLTYEQKGRTAEAINEFLQARILLREEPAYVASLQTAFAKQGTKGFWQQELAHLQTEAKTRYIPASTFAALHARLGDVEQAFKALQQGLTEKDGGLVDLNVTPVFASLRQDARFAELLQKVGLKH